MVGVASMGGGWHGGMDGWLGWLKWWHGWGCWGWLPWLGWRTRYGLLWAGKRVHLDTLLLFAMGQPTYNLEMGLEIIKKLFVIPHFRQPKDRVCKCIIAIVWLILSKLTNHLTKSDGL